MRSVRINVGPTFVAGQRIAAVDELKGLAIILVLIYHCGAALGDENTIHGEIGVDIFLILGGLTLAQPFVRGYNIFTFESVLNPNPTHWQTLEGIFVGLGITLVISVIVHKAVGRLFNSVTARPTIAPVQTVLG
jgi:hypothetical protein